MQIVFIHSACQSSWHNNTSYSIAQIKKGSVNSITEKWTVVNLNLGLRFLKLSPYTHKYTLNTAHEGSCLPPGLTYEALFSEDNDLPAHAYRRFPLWFGQGHILHLKRNQNELWKTKMRDKMITGVGKTETGTIKWNVSKITMNCSIKNLTALEYQAELHIIMTAHLFTVLKSF